MVEKTKKYKVELKGDLLMVKDLNDNLLKGLAVPAWDAVNRFKAMVEKVKEYESKNQSK
jgi:hypothetical protein